MLILLVVLSPQPIWSSHEAFASTVPFENLNVEFLFGPAYAPLKLGASPLEQASGWRRLKKLGTPTGWNGSDEMWIRLTLPVSIRSMTDPLFIITILFVMTFTGRRPIMDVFELDGIRVIKDGMVTVGLLFIGPGQVALIDAGNDPSGKAIIAELARHQLGLDAVKVILLTHGHRDHIAAVSKFGKVQILALTADVPIAEGRAVSRGPLQRLLPLRPSNFKVSRTLHDGETIHFGKLPVRVFSVPGHTAGSAAYLVKGLLFLGDSADADRNGRLRVAPWLFSESQKQNRASLVQLTRRLVSEHVQVRALVFSHSGALNNGLDPLIAFAKKQ